MRRREPGLEVQVHAPDIRRGVLYLFFDRRPLLSMLIVALALVAVGWPAWRAGGGRDRCHRARRQRGHASRLDARAAVAVVSRRSRGRRPSPTSWLPLAHQLVDDAECFGEAVAPVVGQLGEAGGEAYGLALADPAPERRGRRRCRHVRQPPAAGAGLAALLALLVMQLAEHAPGTVDMALTVIAIGPL